jgi:hypothetical protein
MGVIFSLLLSLFLNIHNPEKLKKDFLICFSLYCSHLPLDYISVEVGLHLVYFSYGL